MKNTAFVLPCALLILGIGCSEKVVNTQSFVVNNPLKVDRSFETVELDLKAFKGVGDTEKGMVKNYVIVDSETRKALLTQTVDTNGDGIPDQVLFQPDIKARSERRFEIIPSREPEATDSVPACYSRFVPERTDDYAWENNRVAFRTFGPEAQKMVEEGKAGGTLSSGVDAWLKRVDYPIVNKWYKKETSGKGSYHEDSGEGLDNFHVGASRGVGGIAIKVDTSYYYSKNFSSWRRLYNGPIRTSFILFYADWDANGNRITEKKHISLDYGSNLARFEVQLTGADTISAGLTLHENDGKVVAKPEEGWVSYWEPHDGSELGTGIIIPSGAMTGYEKYITHKTDESNLYVHLRSNSRRVRYYAGFGWKKSGQFETAKAWEDYLAQFAQKINNPLVITIR